jgi:hypothetical protein
LSSNRTLFDELVAETPGAIKPVKQPGVAIRSERGI